MKNITGVLSVCLLLIAYGFIRYFLFHLHGMIEWPLVLVVVAIIIACVSMCLKNDIVPIFTVIGYVAGFGLGLLLHRNGTDAGGGTTSNLWIIWTGVMLCCIMGGIVIFLIKDRRKK